MLLVLLRKTVKDILTENCPLDKIIRCTLSLAHTKMLHIYIFTQNVAGILTKLYKYT
jgi:hypothetical protein